ncbi:hypothetical protein CASFOL_015545 [Castilleja foliolosa]|uniref:Shikimate O-hydroxycinnamoyltransferase n=1 Tax=Castilleja foliolosa TaxID=1961234 RepID=A0ABD3DHW8_9LAMI
MAKVEVLSSCLVPMATNSNAMSRLELTPWDLQLLLLDPIQKGILLHNKPHSQHLQNTLIYHLKTSLSRALNFFPPLAGRLATVVNKENNTQSFFIDCNNAGAEFTHALASNLSVSDIHEAKYIPEIVSNSFFPPMLPNYEGVSKPLLAVQVTELAGGYFISCTGNHAVMDGTSFWHFFNSWSEISRGYEKISKIPVFERWFPSNIDDFNLPITFPALEKNISPNITLPPLLECVFHFSKENVAKLKAKANSEAKTDKISSLQAISAHLWRSVNRMRHRCQRIPSPEVSIHLLVGARPRIPLSEGYFGNAVYVDATEMNVAELLNNGLGYAAMKINELVARQTGEGARKYVDDWVKNPEIIKRGGKSFIITSSPRHNVYGNDFGWGKPIAVRSGKGQKADGKMTLFPSALPGGIDVEACLAPETMRALVDDMEFMEACSNT